METTPITPTPPLQRVFPKKNCEHCNTEFDVKKAGARFCSDTCRGKFFRKSKSVSANGSNAETNEVTDSLFPTSIKNGNHLVASLGGLPAHAQYIISHQNGLLSEKRSELSRMREKYEAAKKEAADLKERIAKMEIDRKIETIENAKPTGLQGIAQSLGSLPPEVLGMIGPSLERIADRIFGPSQPQLPIATVDGQLDADTQHRMVTFSKWYGSIPKDMQESIYAILVTLANSPSPQILQTSLTRIQNILKQYAGTQSVPFTGTFN